MITNIETVRFVDRRDAEILISMVLEYGFISEFDYERYISAFGFRKFEEATRNTITYVEYGSSEWHEAMEKEALIARQMMNAIAYTANDFINAYAFRDARSYGLYGIHL